MDALATKSSQLLSRQELLSMAVCDRRTCSPWLEQRALEHSQNLWWGEPWPNLWGRPGPVRKQLTATARCRTEAGGVQVCLPLCALPLHSVGYFLGCAETFSLMSSHLSDLVLLTCAFGVISGKLLPTQCQVATPLRFLCKSFIGRGLMFKSLIHSELIFAHGGKGLALQVVVYLFLFWRFGRSVRIVSPRGYLLFPDRYWGVWTTYMIRD